MKNTIFSYLYRDSCNYKTYNYAILHGEMTPEQFHTIKECTLDGESFIPDAVGLDELRNFAIDPTVDVPYFELQSFTLTDQKPNTNLTVEQLIENFQREKDNWENLAEDIMSDW